MRQTTDTPLPSLFDLFKIGIGPSSSHTMGPMTAAGRFAGHVKSTIGLESVARVKAELFGSLAMTGAGHGTTWAVELGLAGETPEEADPERVARLLAEDSEITLLKLGREREVRFDRRRDIVVRFGETLDFHPNGLRFSAFDGTGTLLVAREYFSIGGGFVLDEDDTGNPPQDTPPSPLPHPFTSSAQLLDICAAEGKTIADICMANELAWRSAGEVRDRLRLIWRTMRDCMDRGLQADGLLPGKLKVRRRAKRLHEGLTEGNIPNDSIQSILTWINVFAIAVNEENAAGGRVVTAPTNGAAGVIPAVLRYYERFQTAADEDGIFRFLLTAGAIGLLYKRNASISGAEMGCQGEIGVACSMAAAGLTAALNGTNAQVENAAEIGMEHNLGLTCDPVEGLVQIPCIERNAMAAVKAVNAAMIALHGDGQHMVSLDVVIETMRQTGQDMMTKYKETSAGGLAVNVVAC